MSQNPPVNSLGDKLFKDNNGEAISSRLCHFRSDKGNIMAVCNSERTLQVVGSSVLVTRDRVSGGVNATSVTHSDVLPRYAVLAILAALNRGSDVLQHACDGDVTLTEITDDLSLTRKQLRENLVRDILMNISWSVYRPEIDLATALDYALEHQSHTFDVTVSRWMIVGLAAAKAVADHAGSVPHTPKRYSAIFSPIADALTLLISQVPLTVVTCKNSMSQDTKLSTFVPVPNLIMFAKVQASQSAVTTVVPISAATGGASNQLGGCFNCAQLTPETFFPILGSGDRSSLALGKLALGGRESETDLHVHQVRGPGVRILNNAQQIGSAAVFAGSNGDTVLSLTFDTGSLFRVHLYEVPGGPHETTIRRYLKSKKNKVPSFPLGVLGDTTAIEDYRSVLEPLLQSVTAVYCPPSECDVLVPSTKDTELNQITVVSMKLSREGIPVKGVPYAAMHRSWQAVNCDTISLDSNTGLKLNTPKYTAIFITDLLGPWAFTQLQITRPGTNAPCVVMRVFISGIELPGLCRETLIPPRASVSVIVSSNKESLTHAPDGPTAAESGGQATAAALKSLS